MPLLSWQGEVATPSQKEKTALILVATGQDLSVGLLPMFFHSNTMLMCDLYGVIYSAGRSKRDKRECNKDTGNFVRTAACAIKTLSSSPWAKDLHHCINMSRILPIPNNKSKNDRLQWNTMIPFQCRASLRPQTSSITATRPWTQEGLRYKDRKRSSQMECARLQTV